jgi:hypothetical protein
MEIIKKLKEIFKKTSIIRREKEENNSKDMELAAIEKRRKQKEADEKMLTEYLASENMRKQKTEQALFEEIQKKKCEKTQKIREINSAKLKNQAEREESNKIFQNEKERLEYLEKGTRSYDIPVLTEIPKEEIKLMEQEILASRVEKQNVIQNIGIKSEKDSRLSGETFPKKCHYCPDHKNYFDGEIHLCPDCGKWICGRHYHSHIMKNHKSTDYVISGTESGSGSIRIPK